MKTIIRSTSRHPANAVNWLVKFAAAYVYRVAQREGWAHKLDAYPVQITVTNTKHAYCGRSLGVRRFPIDPRNIYAGHEARRCFLVRVGAASRFPTNSTYARYKDMPEARLESWQEAVVGLTAHELTHTHYAYQTGDRKGDEINCELVEQDCVTEFRKHGCAGFDAFMHGEQMRQEASAAREAAKRAPDAILATETAKAEAAVARWTRKAKLAATKLKQWQRRLKRLQAKAAATTGGTAQ